MYAAFVNSVCLILIMCMYIYVRLVHFDVDSTSCYHIICGGGCTFVEELE